MSSDEKYRAVSSHRCNFMGVRMCGQCSLGFERKHKWREKNNRQVFCVLKSIELRNIKTCTGKTSANTNMFTSLNSVTIWWCCKCWMSHVQSSHESTTSFTPLFKEVFDTVSPISAINRRRIFSLKGGLWIQNLSKKGKLWTHCSQQL